jgi:hypothetical protein
VWVLLARYLRLLRGGGKAKANVKKRKSTKNNMLIVERGREGLLKV